MTRQTSQTQLSQFDMMMIRVGGRTQAELEEMVEKKFALDVLYWVGAFVADGLKRLMILLEAGSRRLFEISRRRPAAKAAG